MCAKIELFGLGSPTKTVLIALQPFRSPAPTHSMQTTLTADHRRLVMSTWHALEQVLAPQITPVTLRAHHPAASTAQPA